MDLCGEERPRPSSALDFLLGKAVKVSSDALPVLPLSVLLDDPKSPASKSLACEKVELMLFVNTPNAEAWGNSFRRCLEGLPSASMSKAALFSGLYIFGGVLKRFDVS
jgi:hypothetical protein